jgi:hypothetical protein
MRSTKPGGAIRIGNFKSKPLMSLLFAFIGFSIGAAFIALVWYNVSRAA